ncbi:MAG: glycosyltransferase family 4 protein [Pararobbsia sp.]
MKIAIVTHAVARNDGQGRVNLEIVHAALAAGYDITLVASRVDPALLAEPRVRWVEMPVGRLPTRLLQYQSFAVRAGRWLARHRGEFDIVHLNGFIAWARGDVNTVHFVHQGFLRSGFYPFTLSGSVSQAYQVMFNRINAWLERWAFRHTRVVVPVSHKVASEVAGHGLDVRAMQVIHNGVDTDEFRPGESERARFALPVGAFMLLFAGDLRVSRKNLDTVLDALERLPANVHLAVAADISGENPYAATVAARGLVARVHFLGMIRTMPAAMRSVDAFVFPSRYEAMSLVLLEALSSGLPVVTAKSAGGAEVIDPSCGVVLDDPNNVDGLVAAVAALAAQPARTREMGRAARRIALTLGWQAMGERYLALYRRLAAAPDYQTSSGSAETAQQNTGTL